MFFERYKLDDKTESINESHSIYLKKNRLKRN